MRKIPLTQGKVALVDDEDYEWLARYEWHASSAGHGLLYAARRIVPASTGRQTTTSMHVEIMGHGPLGTTVDHVDLDGLNNQRGNLRFATWSQQNQNQRVRKGRLVDFRGVYPNRYGKPWRARIRVGNSVRHLGNTDAPDEAARMYDEAALSLYGPLARLNFPLPMPANQP